MDKLHKYILEGLNLLISSSREALWTDKSDLLQTGMRSIISRPEKAQQNDQRRQKETSLSVFKRSVRTQADSPDASTDILKTTATVTLPSNSPPYFKDNEY